MKRAVILILVLLMCFSTTGCSMLERSYTSVQPHSSSYYESEDKSVLRAETYQDLVNDLLVLVGEHAEEGTIWLYAAEEMGDVQQAVDAACQEVQNETPIGSYAVEYMTYTISDTNRNYIDLQLTINYRRSGEQMERLVNVTGVTALRDLLAAAAENGASEIAVQLANFYSGAAAVYTIVDEVAAAQETGASWQVQFYPDEERAGIVEIIMGE